MPPRSASVSSGGLPEKDRKQYVAMGRGQAVLVTALFAVMILASGRGVWAGAFLAPDEAGGVRDIVLVYRGKRVIAASELVPLVSYVAKDGRPRAWFFDTVLLLPSSAFVEAAGRKPASRADWERWLDALFGRDGLVDALQAAVAYCSARLGPRPFPLRVFISIPYPRRDPSPFGDLDGDGRPEDMSADRRRLAAVGWFVDRALASWRGGNWPDLALEGFYWHKECVHSHDRGLVAAVNSLVHSHRLKTLWIPWFQAPGWSEWRELGFDIAVMQPNYAFLDPLAGAHLPDEGRLSLTADLARAHGMGVEMETGYALTTSAHDRHRFRLYLNHAITDGFHAAVRAHFHSFDQYQRIARSDVPAGRQLYDDLFALHRGTLAPRPISLLANCQAELVRVQAGTTRPIGPAADILRFNAAPVEMKEGQGLQVNLPRPQRLAEVRVLVAEAPGVSLPRSVDVYGRSSPKAPWRLVASVAEGDVGMSRWIIALWPPQPLSAILIVPSLFPSAKLALRRIVSYPVDSDDSAVAALDAPPADLARQLTDQAKQNIALGCPYRVTPEFRRLYPDEAGELTDGQLTVRGFPDGRTVGWHRLRRVAIEIDLQRPVTVDAVRAHVQGGGLGAVYWPRSMYVATSVDARRWRLLTDDSPSLTVTAGSRAEEGQMSLGWLEQRARGDPPAARWVRITFVPHAWLMVSEVQVISRGRNVARGLSYTLRPLPSADAPYPDDGLKLTDGIVSTSWQRAVGWHNTAAEVVVDLGGLCRVEAVAAHFIGGGAGAVYLPTQVTVQASADGRSWSTSAVARLPDVGEDGKRRLGAWATALLGRRARYIRFRVSGRPGWLMLTEVTAWGPGRQS